MIQMDTSQLKISRKPERLVEKFDIFYRFPCHITRMRATASEDGSSHIAFLQKIDRSRYPPTNGMDAKSSLSVAFEDSGYYVSLAYTRKHVLKSLPCRTY